MGNYIQYLVITYNGRELEKYRCVTESLSNFKNGTEATTFTGKKSDLYFM